MNTKPKGRIPSPPKSPPPTPKLDFTRRRNLYEARDV